MIGVALLLAGGLATYPLVVAEGQPLVLTFAAIGVGAALVTIAGRRGWAYASATAFAAAYLVSLLVSDKPLDAVAPLYGIAVFLFLESCEAAGDALLSSAIRPEVTLARAIYLLSVVGIGGMTGVAVLGAGAVSRVDGPLAFTFAALAALTAVAAIVGVARSLIEQRKA